MESNHKIVHILRHPYIHSEWKIEQTYQENAVQSQCVFNTETYTHTCINTRECSLYEHYILKCMESCVCEQGQWIQLKDFDDWEILYTHF